MVTNKVRHVFQQSFILWPAGVWGLTQQMPCERLHKHRRFLPHLLPGSMRCRFSPELVTPLPHAMMKVFPKTETEFTGSPPSPLSPLTQSASFPLIPKPLGEVARIGRGGYKLKDVLEKQHGWEDGLYDQIRVKATHLYLFVTLLTVFRKECAHWRSNI